MPYFIGMEVVRAPKIFMVCPGYPFYKYLRVNIKEGKVLFTPHAHLFK